MYIVFNNKSIRSYINIYKKYQQLLNQFLYRIYKLFHALTQSSGYYLYMSDVACQTGGPIWLHFLKGTPKVAKADFFIGNFGNSTSAGKRQE